MCKLGAGGVLTDPNNDNRHWFWAHYYADGEGVLTLIGVLVSNSRSKAVLELKIDTLSERVQKHNELISRTYQLESDMAVTRNDTETLYRKVDGR